jgi:hypothetical protein
MPRSVRSQAFLTGAGIDSQKKLGEIMVANALRVFHGGGRMLRRRGGKKIGEKYKQQVVYLYTVGRAPPASVPGESPKQRKGTLAKSVDFKVGSIAGRDAKGRFASAGVVGSTPTKISVFADTPYARRLEFGDHGNKKKGRIDARPLWMPLARTPQVAKMIENETRRAFILGERLEARKLATGFFGAMGTGSGRTFRGRI